MRFKGLAIAAIGLVGALLPMAAGAVQWVAAAESDDKSSRIYVDIDSIKRQGSTVQVWLYYVAYKERADGADALKTFVEVNCAGEDFRVFREIIYVDGQVRSDTKLNTTLTPPPGTTTAATLEAVCRR